VVVVTVLLLVVVVHWNESIIVEEICLIIKIQEITIPELMNIIGFTFIEEQRRQYLQKS